MDAKNIIIGKSSAFVMREKVIHPQANHSVFLSCKAKAALVIFVNRNHIIFRQTVFGCIAVTCAAGPRLAKTSLVNLDPYYSLLVLVNGTYRGMGKRGSVAVMRGSSSGRLVQAM